MRFERPSMKWEAEYITYRKEWDEDRMTPNSLHLNGDKPYEIYLDELPAKEAGHGNRMRNTNYLLIDETIVFLEWLTSGIA